MLKELIDPSWTLFIDRDGVINTRIFADYVKKVEDFHFETGVFEFFKFANTHFHKIIVVTNQQGVGKGLMTFSELEKIHDFMKQTIHSNDGRIDHIYAATNLKNNEFDTRKPLPFMGNKAKLDFPSIDFKKSIMIGDTNSDILFGKNLGMKTVLVTSKEIVTEKPDFSVSTLTDLIF
jgi:D-glycero-D-manno-heptose 1,7-bisphosphate phosphatase